MKIGYFRVLYFGLRIALSVFDQVIFASIYTNKNDSVLGSLTIL